MAGPAELPGPGAARVVPRPRLFRGPAGSPRVGARRAGLSGLALASAVLAVAALALPVAGASRRGGGPDADPKKAALASQTLPLDAPADFGSLRARADALAAGQDTAFRLFQVETELESATLRIMQAHFRYVRPLGRDWEQLDVGISTGGRIRMGQTLGRPWPGRIGGSRTTFSAPAPPGPAPARLIAPEEAIRRLNRARPTGAFGKPGQGSAPSYLRDPSQWRLLVQLLHTGARHEIGHVELSPLRDHVPWPRRHVQPALDDTFFQKTAPRGAWVWWTVLQAPDAPMQRLEYVYMDPASGQATSACADGTGSSGQGSWTPAPCPTAGAGR